MVIADGMGGHRHGEIAAQITVNVLTESFQHHATPRLREPQQFLRHAMQRAHETINAYAVEHQLDEVPHTTCVVCIVQQDTAWWAHAGDSRLYLFSDYHLIARTFDHSIVQQMIDQGSLTESEAALHQERHKIYSCLGGHIPPEIDVSRPIPLSAHDRILLCTDGLWGQLTTEQIVTTLTRLPLSRAIEWLMDEAESRAGVHCDNLSAIAITWESQSLDDDLIISTVAMPDNTFTTNLGHAHGDATSLEEDEVDRMIAEIQHTILKHSEQKK